MSSEIRVNKINNRAGLGTVTYTDTGIIVSGISTASNFKTGTSDLHSAGLNVAYADVDDFVDVGNIIKLGNAGVVTATTFSTSNVDVTTDKIVVGTGVTIEANQVATGQATFTGIVTASAFKLSDGSNVGGIESDNILNTVGGTQSGQNITNSGSSGTSGIENTLYGYGSGRYIAQGDFNTCIGLLAGRNLNNSSNNTLIGYYAGRLIGASNNNTAIGFKAAEANNTNGGITAVGYECMRNATAPGNSALGNNALKNNTSNGYNVAVGEWALRETASGKRNVSIGAYSGQNLSSGEENVFVGYQCGNNHSTGNKNTFIGRGAGSGGGGPQGNNNICIGYETDPIYTVSNGAESNTVTIGDSNIIKFRVPGVSLSIERNGAVIAGVVTATSFSGDGSNLSNLPASAPVGGASTNTVFFENDIAVAVNYQITTNKNAMSAGPIAINAGIAVTVPSGSSWTIV
jgi:hypothetical protein